MKRKIVYLINPIAGTRQKAAIQELVVRRTREKKISFDVLPTNEAGDYFHLVKKITREGITDVVVIGGDGTVNSVAASLTGIEVNVGIIPVGSGNGLAFAAKIPKQPSKALDIIFKGHSSFIDSFYINDQFSCMLCGIGFDAKVAHEFAKQKRRGLETYIKVSAINFFKASSYPFKIEMKGKSINSDAFFICVANSNQFGNNVTIAPKASLSDGLLDIVIVTKMSKFLLPFSLLSQITGINAIQHIKDYSGKENIIYLQTESLVIKNPGMAPLHIDGEPKNTSSEFRVRVLKNAFRLLQPL